MSGSSEVCGFSSQKTLQGFKRSPLNWDLITYVILYKINIV